LTVAAVSRALSIIECLAGAIGGRELGEIAERVMMPKSAAHRVLSTLVERGWVVQDRDTQNYVLSLRVAALAFHDRDVRVVTDVVQAILDELARRTGEYCRLAVVEGETLTWVSRAQGATTGLRYDADMGQEVALHATATGKAWLSTLPESEAVRIVTERDFFRHMRLGPNVARNAKELRQRLAEARARGYAIAVEEAEPGIVALATTFRSDARPDAPVAGTVSVAGPMSRIGPDRYDELGARLIEAAGQVESAWRVRTRQRGAGYGQRTVHHEGGRAAG
jgi:DNA-binding IclR family transcriptional regulator